MTPQSFIKLVEVHDPSVSGGTSSSNFEFRGSGKAEPGALFAYNALHRSPQHESRKPVAERGGDVHRMSFARSATEAVCTCGWHKKYANAGPNWRSMAKSDHLHTGVGRRVAEALLAESSHELSYNETLYRGDEQLEINVVITATYYAASAGEPRSHASGGSPPDAAYVDPDSICATRVDGSREMVELNAEERAEAEARFARMVEGGFVDDFGADDRD